MIKYNLSIIFRILWQNKLFSLINIIGLAIGLCSSIIVFLYVQHEFSFDRFHDDSDRIYRFIMHEDYKGSIIEHPLCRMPVGPALKNDFPEIEQVVRTKESSLDISFEDNIFLDNDLLYVDLDFFNVFDFRLISGNPDLALQDPNSIILTKSLAKKIFGDINPVGRTISTISGTRFIISGISMDPPTNTHFKFDMLLSTSKIIGDGSRFSWEGGTEFEIFVKLRENVDLKLLNSKFASFFEFHISGRNMDGHLQPIKDMYFHSTNFSYVDNTQHYSDVLLFALISIFILFIAIINYINLSTARSFSRAKEVGVRKVVGASRIALIRQFVAESYLVLLISTLLALILIEIFLPSINNLFNYELNLYNLGYQNVLLILFAFFIVVGSLSALYPALFLSSFKPIKVLKGVHSANGKSKFRMGLVIFQFIISSVLISCTLYSVQQLSFVRNKKPGYDRDHLMVVKLTAKLRKKNQNLKNEVLMLSGVKSVAGSSGYPGINLNGDNCMPEGMTTSINVRLLEGDPEYIKTMGMHIIEGRDFSSELATDKGKYIINKTLADRIGWDNPIGKKLNTFLGRSTIIGVVDDFHMKSLKSKIEPLILTSYEYLGFWWLNVRLEESANTEIILREIEAIIKNTDQTQPLIYNFLDDTYEQEYRAEIKFSKLFQLFSFLAIFIACLGLLGLASFSAEQRIKEIGIRKVMGASQRQLLSLMSKQYFLIVIVANAIAFPISFYLLRSWQNTYAYHVDLSITLFVTTLLINSIIAAVIIYMQTVKATARNPIESLKYE